MFDLLPKYTLAIFWLQSKHWSLFGWLPTFWHANGSLPTLVHFFAKVGQLMGTQNHGQNSGLPNVW
jgi:hypothetical protein